MKEQKQPATPLPRSAYKPKFKPWWEAGFGRELLPIIPINATLFPGNAERQPSKVSPVNRGKVPGVRNADSTWSGLGGNWPDALFPKAKRLQQWDKWGAGIGMQGRTFTGTDIDVSDKALADVIVALAERHMGATSIRWRSNSARVLLMYHCPELRKRRVAFRVPGHTAIQAVEQLGKGQYYNIDGLHPSGERYKWRNGHPFELKAEGITKITEAQVSKFFAALVEYLDMMGYEIVRASGSRTSTPERKGLDNPALHAPRPEHVLEVLRAIPCNDVTFPSRDDFIAPLAAIKAALGEARDEYWPIVLDWTLQYPGAEEDYVTKIWDSIKDAAVGWGYLEAWARRQGFTEGAQRDFSDDLGVTTDSSSVGMPARTAIEEALDRYIWCTSMECFYDTHTHTTLTPNAFNSVNIGIADYGRSGVQSSTATWMNSPSARKVHTTTYRVGQPLIVQEGDALALNLWRPNTNFSTATNVSDEDVKPWLDHMQLIFGPQGSTAMEHILNVMSFFVQKQGQKLNHAIVIYGGKQGTGKDTCFVPLTRFLGDHNVKNLQPEAVTGQFNDFLCSQICFINEMINFEKKATMNRMKPWLAAPPSTITVNKKFAHPFTIPNVVNWVIYTNYPDAISMDDADRRFWVHECLLGSPMPADYYEKLHGFYNAGGAEKVIGWLQRRDITSFNRFAPPPMTEAKREMINQTMPPAVRWVRDQFMESGSFAGRTVLIVSELLRVAMDDFNAGAPPGVNHKSVSNALRAEGFVNHEHHRVRIGGDLRQLWVRDPSGLLAKLSADQLRQRYLAELDRASVEKAA